LAVAATLGLGWMAVARLAPGYAGALAQLGEAPTRRARRARPSPGAERAPGSLVRWWLRDPVECAAFQLTAVYLRRDRETKTPLFHGVRKAAIYYVILPGAVIALLWIAATDAEKLPVAVPSLLALPFLSLLPAAGRDYVPLSEPPTTGRQSTANVVVGMLITLV